MKLIYGQKNSTLLSYHMYMYSTARVTMASKWEMRTPPLLIRTLCMVSATHMYMYPWKSILSANVNMYLYMTLYIRGLLERYIWERKRERETERERESEREREWEKNRAVAGPRWPLAISYMWQPQPSGKSCPNQNNNSDINALLWNLLTQHMYTCKK